MTEVVQVLKSMSEARTEQVVAFLNKKQPVMALLVVYRGPIGTIGVLIAIAILRALSV